MLIHSYVVTSGQGVIPAQTAQLYFVPRTWPIYGVKYHSSLLAVVFYHGYKELS
jgi:hypothetical protein